MLVNAKLFMFLAVSTHVISLAKARFASPAGGDAGCRAALKQNERPVPGTDRSLFIIDASDFQAS